MSKLIQPLALTASAAVLAFGLLFSLASCGVHPQKDSSSNRTAVSLSLNLAEEEASPLASGLAAGTFRYEALIHITGPDLTEPIRYLLHNLQPGSSTSILVPSGSSRTFEVWIYEIPSTPPALDTFPATLLVTVTPLALRTIDLTGEQVNLQLQVAPTTDLTSVGTYNGDGYFEINDPAGRPQLLPGDCNIVTNVTFVDVAFDNLQLGPVAVHVGLSPDFLDGEYLITGVPRERIFQLLVTQPWDGWSGESDPVLISNDLNPNPVNVLLDGYQPIAVSPLYDYVADGRPLRSVHFNATGGSGSYSFSSYLISNGYATVSSGGVYSVIGTVGADTLDLVTVADACFQFDTAKAAVFWYLAPVLVPGESPPVSPSSGSELGGDYVWLYGMGFDHFTQVFFGDNLAPTIYFLDYYDMEAVTSPHPPGFVDVRVYNPRSNPLFPEFTGFDFTLSNGFEYYAGGPANKFEAPFVGNPSHYQYTP